MKAGRTHFYGGPEQLVYEDASQPHPVKNQVLIRVYARSHWNKNAMFARVALNLLIIRASPLKVGY
jgi:NADPH:quinone reductase-like Zn-dependent oxidoreductase